MLNVLGLIQLEDVEDLGLSRLRLEAGVQEADVETDLIEATWTGLWPLSPGGWCPLASPCILGPLYTCILVSW